MPLPIAQMDQKIKRCTCGAWIYDKPTCDYPHNYKDYK